MQDDNPSCASGEQKDADQLSLDTRGKQLPVLDARRKDASILGRQGKYSHEDEWGERKKTPVLRNLRAWEEDVCGGGTVIVLLLHEVSSPGTPETH